METIKRTLMLIFLVTFVLSCEKDVETSIPQNDIDAPTVDVKIIAPDGVDLNLSKTKLISFLEEFPVDNNGNTKAILNKGGHTLAVLMDKNDAVLMMGFISDSKKEISVKSTAEASLYISLGKILEPYVIQKKFFEESDQLPFYDDFQNKIKALFQSNSFIESTGFMELLKTQTDNIVNDGQKVDVYQTRASVEVDGADIRSGIQLEEKSGTTFAVTNQYRRRVHGFLYKMSNVDKNDKKNILINDVLKDKAKAKIDFSISPTQGFTSVTGTIGDVGSDFFRTTTDDIPLELGAAEKESLYKLRTVGPSLRFSGIDKMTQPELDKLRELTLETLVYEICLPTFLTVIGHDEIVDKINGKKLAKYKKTLELALSSIPAIEDAMKQGDLKTANYEFMKALVNNALGGSINDILKALAGEISEFATTELGTDYFVKNKEFIKGSIKKADVIFKIFDGIMLANDVTVRQFIALKNSSILDEWDVKAKENKVTLSLIDKIALPGISADMEAIVKDFVLPGGTALEYHWSTSGKYGVLNDGNGKEGTSIVTSRDKVKYVVTASDAQISDESYDGLSVIVYTKKGQTNTKLNSDTDTIQIRTHGYRLKPDGITISGNTNLEMYIRYSDGSNFGGANSISDYRIVWTTSGTYGHFSESGRSTITTINQTDVNYKCTNWVTAKGSESFSARIYSKKKGEPESKYRIVDEVNATINIENDENKMIFYVPIELRETPWPSYGVPQGLSLVPGFRFTPISPPPNKEIEKYTITGIEYIGDGGRDYTYLCGSKTFYPGNEAEDFDYYGQYFLACGGGTQTNKEVTYAIIRGSTRIGYARVIAFLKPKKW